MCTLRPDIYKVSTVGKGTLYVMPRPSSEWLSDDVKYFSGIGVNVVVSHLEKDEETEVGLTEEANALKKHDIEFLSYPIEDRGLPDLNSFASFVETIYLKLVSGENIAVHCRAGIGRTGLTSACLLIRDGLESEIAMDNVSSARGTQIPDTQEQYDFICDFRMSLERLL